MKRLSLVVLCLLCASTVWAVDIPEVAIQTVAMEASNQSDEGQYLVASVIVNRAKGSLANLEGVCLARKQFSCWNDPKWAKAWLGRHYTSKTRLRASNALKMALEEPYPGIKHYHTTQVKPYWAKGKRPVIIEGAHAFYDNVK